MYIGEYILLITAKIHIHIHYKRLNYHLLIKHIFMNIDKTRTCFT